MSEIAYFPPNIRQVLFSVLPPKFTESHIFIYKINTEIYIVLVRICRHVHNLASVLIHMIHICEFIYMINYLNLNYFDDFL